MTRCKCCKCQKQFLFTLISFHRMIGHEYACMYYLNEFKFREYARCLYRPHSCYVNYILRLFSVCLVFTVDLTLHSHPAYRRSDSLSVSSNSASGICRMETLIGSYHIGNHRCRIRIRIDHQWVRTERQVHQQLIRKV